MIKVYIPTIEKCDVENFLTFQGPLLGLNQGSTQNSSIVEPQGAVHAPKLWRMVDQKNLSIHPSCKTGPTVLCVWFFKATLSTYLKVEQYALLNNSLSWKYIWTQVWISLGAIFFGADPVKKIQILEEISKKHTRGKRFQKLVHLYQAIHSFSMPST